MLSGLAMAMDTSALMATRCGLSPAQPLAVRLWMLLFASTLSLNQGDEGDDIDDLIFTLLLLVSPYTGWCRYVSVHSLCRWPVSPHCQWAGCSGLQCYTMFPWWLPPLRPAAWLVAHQPPLHSLTSGPALGLCWVTYHGAWGGAVFFCLWLKSSGNLTRS